MQYYEVQDTANRYPPEKVFCDWHEGAVARYALRVMAGKPVMAGADYWDIAVIGDVAQTRALMVADCVNINPDTDGDDVLEMEEILDGEVTLYHAYRYGVRRGTCERTPLGSFICNRLEE